MTGSNSARTVPTRTFAARSSAVRPRNRSLLAVLGPEGLDQHRGLEALVRDVGDVGAQPLGPHGRRRHVPLEEEVREHGERQDRERGEREPQVGAHERDGGDADHHHDAERERQRVEDAGGGLDVGARVGQQLAGRVARGARTSAGAGTGG